jgi:sporadic carbohydrate cluster protein (TIGR04323 family)
MRIPVPAQNSCIREYVSQKNGTYILPNLESSFENCFHQLFGAINILHEGDMIVMYSLTMLPDGNKLDTLITNCKNKKIGLAFVLENISITKNFSKILDELESYKLSKLELNLDEWELLVEQYY